MIVDNPQCTSLVDVCQVSDNIHIYRFLMLHGISQRHNLYEMSIYRNEELGTFQFKQNKTIATIIDCVYDFDVTLIELN